MKCYLAAALLILPVAASATGECLSRAAVEFDIPPAVLEAIHQEERTALNPTASAREFGPMRLGEAALDRAGQSGARIDAELARMDPCENFRAAAWFLADARDRAARDLWQGVSLYYGGEAGSTNPRVQAIVERVRRTFDVLNGGRPNDEHAWHALGSLVDRRVDGRRDAVDRDQLGSLRAPDESTD